MIILETLILSRNRRTLLPPELRANLAKIVAVALAVYLVVRFQDMAGRGVLHEMGHLNYHSLAFYAEILVGFVAPFLLLLSRKVRSSSRALFCATLMVLVGFASNRMNTAITGMEHWPDHTYFPSLPETLIMLGIAAVGFSAFYLIARFLPIFQETRERREQEEAWDENVTTEGGA